MVAEDWADAVGGNLRLGKALPQMNQQLLEELLLLQKLHLQKLFYFLYL